MAVSAGRLLSGLVVVAAVCYFYYGRNQQAEQLLRERLDQTLTSLLRAERRADPRTCKVAVGFGSCRDVVVRSWDVLLKHHECPDHPEHFHSIATLEELLKVFAYFFRHGAAAERYVSNSSLFKELVSAARDVEGVRWSLGGNAAVMAARFAKEGCNVLLGAQMTPDLKKLLSEDVDISGPTMTEADDHLLLEYQAGEKWGDFVAPRANRFIIHNDNQNPLLASVENFDREMRDFSPKLLVISGLQMMDNFPIEEDIRRERLEKVREIMVRQPDDCRIHFEMASFADTDLLNELTQLVIPHADSLGMNEQELPNLYSILAYGNVSLVAESYPRVAVVLDQMRDVFRLLQENEDLKSTRKLTRLHVHTLAFQAIMTKRNSQWKNSMSAAAKAALTAHRHTCGSHKIDTAKAKLIMDDSFTTTRGQEAKRIPFEANRPVACWIEDDAEICVAPVLVCTEVLQTGGGGDNISSAGLVLQV